MSIDPELEAMQNLHTALKDLDTDARQRVLRWAISRFAEDIQSESKVIIQPDNLSIPPQTECLDLGRFSTIADLFALAQPKTETQKVLLSAAFLQHNNDGTELTGREINNELNHLGHGVKNITVAVNGLMNRKPCLMIQTRKEGRTKQAQKKYKVTVEGFNAIRKMLSESNGEQI